MMETPAYLTGRGRGRGRGKSVSNSPHPGRLPGQSASPTQSTNVWASNTKSAAHRKENKDQQNISSKDNGGDKGLSRFDDAASKHQAAAQKHLITEEYESSDEEEQLNDDKIISSLLTDFDKTSADMGPRDLGITAEYLTNSIKSKANVCLICIETIKRVDSIWSCHGCYCMFHISCIQKWVRDGAYQQSLQSDDDLRGHDLPWNCPKCRHEYKQSQSPRRYTCFCGKETDPKPDPWLIPHSCGQVCHRPLVPGCGHSCLLLCHPGPCPPCPQTVRATCFCGKRSPQMRRCGTQKWSCCQPCGLQLKCRIHRCKTLCHDEDCPECQEISLQACRCGRSTIMRACADPFRQCDKVCGKAFSCGQHLCEKVCHDAECGACPRSGQRTCPCNKSVHDLPCTEEVPTCFDTCGKRLACGVHTCNEKCHYGPCGTCREMSRKKCLCGRKEKVIQCYKDFQCDVKCNRIKDCGKHSCKRKCCDGNCPPCDQPCNKMLICRNHKCSSRCHQGRCYPCQVIGEVSCACGATSKSVPCGKQRATKPPKCFQNCRNPPDCHHKERVAHACHFEDCPTCQQLCDKLLPCKHRCPRPCHSAVLTHTVDKVERSGPWEAIPQPRLELINQPCPPCKVPVSVTCLGAHETVTVACADARVSSCFRPCGRSLSCTNHTCQLLCHKVNGAVDDQLAGTNCARCEDRCGKPKMDGCSHACVLPCHPGPCPPCKQMIRMRCHCKQMVKYVQCEEWRHADEMARQRLQSCQSPCPKVLACGHTCKTMCHVGSCPSSERCLDKVKVHCKCKFRKQRFLCNDVQAGYGKLECDDSCEQNKEKQNQKKQEQLEAEKEEAKRLEQAEIEEFKRKMEPKRRKPKKTKPEIEKPSFIQKYKTLIVAPMLVLLLSVFIYYLFQIA